MHGRGPATLEELKVAMLTDLPVDPYDGWPLPYRRTPDGGVIYAGGPDG